MLVALRKATSAAVMPTRSRGHLSRLRSIDGDARCNKQIKLAAQRDELATNLTNGLAIVLAEIRDGLEVRRQLPGQPDHLDIALALPLQASARWHPIEVTVDVELEHNAGMVAGSAHVEWLDDEAEPIEIQPVHEYVDRSHRIVLGHVVVEQRREQCALPAIHPFHEPRHRSHPPADSLENHSRGDTARRGDTGGRHSFHTAWAISSQSRRGKRPLF